MALPKRSETRDRRISNDPDTEPRLQMQAKRYRMRGHRGRGHSDTRKASVNCFTTSPADADVASNSGPTSATKSTKTKGKQRESLDPSRLCASSRPRAHTITRAPSLDRSDSSCSPPLGDQPSQLYRDDDDDTYETYETNYKAYLEYIHKFTLEPPPPSAVDATLTNQSRSTSDPDSTRGQASASPPRGPTLAAIRRQIDPVSVPRQGAFAPMPEPGFARPAGGLTYESLANMKVVLETIRRTGKVPAEVLAEQEEREGSGWRGMGYDYVREM